MTIHPVSWLDIAFYATFLIPNIILQLSLHELIILLGLAVPYGNVTHVNAKLTSDKFLLCYLISLRMIDGRVAGNGRSGRMLSYEWFDLRLQI